MAKYSYNELKIAAMENRRIGGYQGKNVFSCSKLRYDAKRHQDNFYVLYDDGNKLVHKGMVYGTINEKGIVDEWERQRTWTIPTEPSMTVSFEPVAPKAKSSTSQKTIPASDYSALVNGGEGIVSPDNYFANLDREINELLNKPFDMGDLSWAQ